MRRSVILLAVLTTVLSSCAVARQEGAAPAPVVRRVAPAPEPAQVRAVPAALQPADDCDVLLEYFVEQALEQVGPWGLGGGGYRGVWTDATMAAAESADGAGADSGQQPSTTNVQVAGVDEGDFVKASGDELYVLTGGKLIAYSTADEGLDRLDTLELAEAVGWGQMLLEGDRLVVVGAGFDHFPLPVEPVMDIAPAGAPLTRLTLVDVSDPANLTVLDRITIDGSLVTTRMVEGRLRVVLEAYPVGLDWARPEGSGLRAEREATERNRDIIRQSTIENWLPWYVAESGAEGTLMECGDVYLPPEPSGVSTLSILDFDISAGIEDWQTASVVAAGSTVYANADRTYVATQRWFDQARVESEEAFSGHVTSIHRFDTPVDGDLAYVASGDVDGFLLNQFAMDEFQGNLRVATTTAPQWWGGGEDSVSQVTVLAPQDDRLETIGSVGGLGETETIRAVRFMGPVGYVVTFRQTDPLYVIDLSDPRAPEAKGELKIPGYSGYLHPAGDGRLLGVGQDADPETGAVHGLQLSLFDVSDPAAPERLDTYAPPAVTDEGEKQIWSPVEADHKAFTVADDTGYVPYEGWSWSEDKEAMYAGLIVVDWSDDSFEGSRVLEMFGGKPRGDEWGFVPQRTVVKGNALYAIGHSGVTQLAIDSGEVVERVGF